MSKTIIKSQPEMAGSDPGVAFDDTDLDLLGLDLVDGKVDPRVTCVLHFASPGCLAVHTACFEYAVII